jgi:malate synthase
MKTITASSIATFKTPLQTSIKGQYTEGYAEILSADALKFLKALHTRFNSRRLTLLKARDKRQTQIDAHQLPNFLPETLQIRESDWTIAPLPPDLQDRRVEITGPVDRKMVINALNSGAKVFMADLEDSNTPSWDNNIQGQINLRDAVNRTISFQNEKGKTYQLNETIATLLVRPRGWHLNEKHITINGEETSGSLMDFGLYFFHNYKTLMSNS